jgi:hypothetical protein
MIVLLSTVEVSPRDTACGQERQMIDWYGSFFSGEMGAWDEKDGR